MEQSQQRSRVAESEALQSAKSSHEEFCRRRQLPAQRYVGKWFCQKSSEKSFTFSVPYIAKSLRGRKNLQEEKNKWLAKGPPTMVFNDPYSMAVVTKVARVLQRWRLTLEKVGLVPAHATISQHKGERGR